MDSFEEELLLQQSKLKSLDLLYTYLGLGSKISFKNKILEQDFFDEYGRHSIDMLYAYIPTIIYLFVVGFLSMILLFPDIQEPKIICVIECTNVSILFLYNQYFKPKIISVQRLLTVLQTLVGWLISIGLLSLQGHMFQFYVIVIVAIHLLSGSLCSSILFSYVLVFHHFVVIGFAVIAIFSGALNMIEGILQSVLLGGISTICLFTVYHREIAVRVQFLQRKMIELREIELAKQKGITESLLLNILPDSIAIRLKNNEQVIADVFPMVTVVFADIVGFTSLSSKISPENLVKKLNQLFSIFDDLAEKHGLEKIKTIGDAYMVAAGLPEPHANHATAAAEMALEMIQAVVHSEEGNSGQPLRLRVGLNSGPVIAGIIGKKKFSYDLWGDVVNVASRMESHGIAGEIQVTSKTYELLKDKYDLKFRGKLDIKGKEMMETYLLKGRL